MNQSSCERPLSAASPPGGRPATSGFSAGPIVSPADLVPEILDDVADFAAALAECFLDFAFGLVGFAFVAEPIVVRQLARAFFDLSFSAIDLPSISSRFHIRSSSWRLTRANGRHRLQELCLACETRLYSTIQLIVEVENSRVGARGVNVRTV
jgi:hypothetical protein